tara:strand:- start:852 stop:1508 length:657 start_codon:yes stop_codon:yes gene_type:complete
MTDSRDGEIYETVTYNINGKQITWMAQNLRYETEGASVYDNVSSYKKKLGLLYTSNAVNSSCPKGWHLPTVSEWESLTALFGGYYKASKTLKSERGWEWNEKLAEGLARRGKVITFEKGNNSSSFNALPAGWNIKRGTASPYYLDIGNLTVFWTLDKDDSKVNPSLLYRLLNRKTEQFKPAAGARHQVSDKEQEIRDNYIRVGHIPNAKASCRCVKND